ncbi:SPOR domain-containing protein [Sphingomonas sp.]|uniref:SPOR domain-containing protein n=1 Tax=Sphingomonas sp. TaxID=28214 RepID=UPI0025DD0FE1|nr:SPOR domain-containing protein [Sphingomonas sp.]
MTDTDREPLPLNDHDRLPWLEAVEDEDNDRVSTRKLAGFVIAAIAALGLVIGGVWLLRHSGPGPQGDGKLIAAQEGDYKVRPDTPGGMKVEGQGDSAFAASEGAEANGKIDLNATAETPVASGKAGLAKTTAAPAAKVATASMPASGGKLIAAPPAKPSVRGGAAAASGALVQLGSFNSEAQASAAWVKLTKRFAYLALLAKSVEPATVNGSTFYRLRANAGGDASTICGKLKVAGENCFMVN